MVIFQVDPASAGVQYDKEFIVCSLDLLSGLAEGLGSGIESLVFLFLHVFWSENCIRHGVFMNKSYLLVLILGVVKFFILGNGCLVFYK